MKLARWLVLGACAFVAGAAVADNPPAVATGFATDAQGWGVENGALSFAWTARGGDPGGYISANDDPNASSALWFFAAPARFLGHKPVAYGGTLAFSLESLSDSPRSTTPRANVQLLGNNGVLLAFGGGDFPGTDWTRYSVKLIADGAWTIGSVGGPAATEADFRSVLGDLLALRITGDYYTGVEKTSLDSVVLVAAAVPEPGTVLMWLAGGVALLGIVRRRRPREA